MKIHTLIHDKFKNLPHRQQTGALLLIVVVCLLLIIFLFKCCSPAKKKQLASTPMMIRQGNQITIPSHSPLRTHLTIKSVSSTNLSHIVSLSGVVEANPAHTVNIFPPLTGRLISLNANIGDFVKKNQILAIINSPDLAQASSDHDKAVDTLKLMTEAFTRAKNVNRAGGSAIKDVQQAQNNYIQALAEAKRAADRLKTLGNNGFSQLPILAPMDGKITVLNYGIGSYITDPTAILMSISDLKTIWVTANVPENLVGTISKNQQVEISLSAYPEQKIKGTISFVNAVLDPDTRCNKTRIVLSNPDGKLQPNMYSTVHVIVPELNLITIPTSAILMNEDTTSVYVETAPWIFERRTVELGAEDGKVVRILSGLKTGNRIVINGGIFIN